MSLKIAIITGKLGTRDASSSTVIANEAVSRGYKVYEFEAQNLRYSEGLLLAEALDYPSKEAKEINLEEMDVILFRPNPPVDMEYLTTLFLLRTIEDKVLIINRPSSIINLPEKIFPLYLKEHIPPTLITSSLDHIRGFAEKHGDIIIKPLYNFGGREIVKYSSEFTLKNNLPVVAQKFLPQVINGDTRVLVLGEEVICIERRVPAQNSFLANISMGGTSAIATLSSKEEQIVKKVITLLKNEDILVAGIDLIGEFITEINITSVGGLELPDDFYLTNPEKKLWDIIESKLK